MKYSHIARYVAETPWAILPSKLTELLGVLAFRAAGHEFTAEEIKARLGEGGASLESRAEGERRPPAGSRDVAIIPIRGVIAHRMGSMDDSSGGTSCERIAAMLRAVVGDPNIATIVFDVDSPGGTVTGMAELAAEVFAARETKHLISVANGMICSAAYDIASQAHEIVSIPSGVVGSIGVFTAHEDLSAALEKEGITITLISAGKYKTENNPFEPLTEEGRAILQSRVDAAYTQFVKDVARGRGVSSADVRKGYGEGRALQAKDAKAAGLIDRIATMDEVIGKLVGRTPRGGGMRAAMVAQALAEGRDPLHTEEDLPASLAQADGDDGRAEDLRRRRLL